MFSRRRFAGEIEESAQEISFILKDFSYAVKYKGNRCSVIEYHPGTRLAVLSQDSEGSCYLVKVHRVKFVTKKAKEPYPFDPVIVVEGNTEMQTGRLASQKQPLFEKYWQALKELEG